MFNFALAFILGDSNPDVRKTVPTTIDVNSNNILTKTDVLVFIQQGNVRMFIYFFNVN